MKVGSKSERERARKRAQNFLRPRLEPGTVSVPLSIVHACVLIHIQLFVIPWKAACWAPLSLIVQARIWSIPIPPPGDLPDTGIEPAHPAFPA